MAERQRTATRLIQPGNPMRYSPTVQGSQGDTRRLNDMQGIANSLLSLSDSFAGAFKARAEVSDAEYRKQFKIEQSIKEEKKTADILRGKFIAMQRGLQPQSVLDSETPEFVKGYKTQIYSQKIEDDNEYIKSLAPDLAGKIYARHSQLGAEAKKNGQYHPPLAEYASVFIQQEKDRLLSGYEDDPIAWEVFTEKGFDFNPLHESLSKIMGKDAKTRRNTVLAERVQHHHSKTIHGTYRDFEAVDGLVGININGVNFYTRGERQNAYLQHIENELEVATSPDDPVFRRLDFTHNSKPSDGIGFKLSQEPSTDTTSQNKTISERYYKLVDKLREKQEQLQKKQDNENLTGNEKQEKAFKLANKMELNVLYGRLVNVSTQPQADEILKHISDPKFIARMRFGVPSNSGINLTILQNKYHDIINSKTLNPDYFEPDDKQSGEMEQIEGKLEQLKSQASTGSVTTDMINRYSSQILPYEKLKGGSNLRKLLGEVQLNKHTYDESLKTEAGKKAKELQDEQRGKSVFSIYKKIAELERGEVKPNEIPGHILGIKRELNRQDHKDFIPVSKHFNTVVTQLTDESKVENFTKNGQLALSSAQTLTSDPASTAEQLNAEITRIENIFNIDAGNKKEALTSLYNRLFQVREAKTLDSVKDAKIAFRERIYKASSDEGKLNDLISEAKDKGYPELMKEAQGYVNVIKTRAYNKQVKIDEKKELKEEKSKAQKKRRTVFKSYVNLSGKIKEAVLSNDREALSKIRSDYLSKFRNAQFSQVPELDELIQSDLRDASIALKEKDIADGKKRDVRTLKQQAQDSKDGRDTQIVQSLVKINDYLLEDTPNIAEAKKLVGSMYRLQQYEDGNNQLRTRKIPLFETSTQLRILSDIRIAQHKHEAKTNGKKGVTDPKTLTTIHKELYGFPTQGTTEDSKVFDDRAKRYHADTYKKITNAFTNGKLGETTFERVKKSLDALLAGGPEARKERLKNDPADIVNTYRTSLYQLVGKSDTAYFNLAGAATFFDNVNVSRNELYQAMLEEYDLAISTEYNTNYEKFTEEPGYKIERVKEIYTEITQAPIYAEALESIKNQLQVKQGEALKKGFESPTQGDFKQRRQARLRNYTKPKK